VVDRLIYGHDTTFDAEDARALDRLLPTPAPVLDIGSGQRHEARRQPPPVKHFR
jgi:hypothetical protein